MNDTKITYLFQVGQAISPIKGVPQQLYVPCSKDCFFPLSCFSLLVKEQLKTAVKIPVRSDLILPSFGKGNQAFTFFSLARMSSKEQGGRVGEEDTGEGRGDTPSTAAVRNLTRSLYRNPEDVFKDCFFNKNFHKISNTGEVAPDANRSVGLDHKVLKGRTIRKLMVGRGAGEVQKKKFVQGKI